MPFRTLSLLLLLLIGGGCSNLLYYPNSVNYHDPNSLKLNYDEVFLEHKRSDGKVHARYFKSKNPTALVLFFHGNAQNLTSHYLTLAWLPQYNVDFFIFDYRGYGQSTQTKPSPLKTVEDGLIALEWAVKKGKELKIPVIVFAQSLGGAIAMKSLSEFSDKDEVKLLVIDSSFLSYKDAGQAVMKQSWLTWPFQWLSWVLLSDEHAPKKSIHHLKSIPFVVMHGTDDRTVPFQLGENLYHRFPGEKEFWVIPEGQHTDSFWGHRDKYKKKFLAKIKQIAQQNKEQLKSPKK